MIYNRTERIFLGEVQRKQKTKIMRKQIYKSMNMPGVLVLLVEFVVVMSLIACSSTIPNTPMHQTYTFKSQDSFNTDWHSGDKLPVAWAAQRGATVAATKPASVTLTVDLIGPFPNIDAVLNAIRQSKASHTSIQGAVTISAPPVQTDNWSNQSSTSIVTIPQHTPAGYYALVMSTITRSRSGNMTTQTDGLIRVDFVIHIKNLES